METTVKAGQSFLDKVLEKTGSVENAFTMAFKNNMSITDTLINGDSLLVTDATNRVIIEQWNERKLPATALTANDDNVIIPSEGIGAMIIEETLIVS